MSGIEIVGLVATVGGLATKSALFVDKLRSARKLSAENKPLCVALARQLTALVTYVEEMQGMQPVELEKMGALWAGALAQLAIDMAAIEKKLSELTATKSRSRTNEAVVELKNVGDMSAALRYAETKLWVSWSRLQALVSRRHMVQFAEECSAGFGYLGLQVETVRAEANAARRREAGAARRDKEDMCAHISAHSSAVVDILRDQSRSLGVIERVLNLYGESLSMVKLTAIVEEGRELLCCEKAKSSLSSDRFASPGQARGRMIACENLPGFAFDYEDERKRLEELHPRLLKFWRRLERGKIGKRMSDEERRDLATLIKRLWMPWKLERSAVKRSPNMLGIGTFGVVFKGKLKINNQRVAVKVMREDFVLDKFRADFFREASLLHRLRHPAIVTFYGAWWPVDTSLASSSDSKSDGDEEEYGFVDSTKVRVSSVGSDSDGDSVGDANKAALVMERMDGHIGMLVESGKISDFQDIYRGFIDTAEALCYIHGQGVLHLDVKPENILGRTTSEGRLLGRVKLTDFGVSRKKQSSMASRSFWESQRSTFGSEPGVGAVGTPVFMAPEILLRSVVLEKVRSADVSVDCDGQMPMGDASDVEVSFECDVYSFGITICRVVQLKLAKDGMQVPSPTLFFGSEGELSYASSSGKLAAAVKLWVDRVVEKNIELREIVLACVQTIPCDRPSMKAVLMALKEIASGSQGSEKRICDILEGLDEASPDIILEKGIKYRDGDGVEEDLRKAFVLISRSAKSGNNSANKVLALLYRDGCGVAKDVVKACELYQIAVDDGDADAAFYLGNMYEKGAGVEKDCVKACELYQIAIDGGSAIATYNFGNMYRKGVGVAKDDVKACDLYQIAVDGGDAVAALKLGLMFENGDGVTKDAVKACELYQIAVDGGSAIAAFNLGNMYRKGVGVAKDTVEACDLYQIAVDGGDTNAAFYLGNMHCKGVGVAKDAVKACELYQIAVDGGSAIAALKLGNMYRKGVGVAKNDAKACKLYQIAVDGRDAVAALKLGLMFQNGDGVAKDAAKACELYQIAVDGGSAIAAFNLGIMFQKGVGVAKDNVKACKLYQIAVDGGDAIAAFNLGNMYRKGVGVDKDAVKACELYQISVDGGDADAALKLGLMYQNGDGVTKDA